MTGFLDLSTLKTLNDLEPHKKGFLVNFLQFLDLYERSVLLFCKVLSYSIYNRGSWWYPCNWVVSTSVHCLYLWYVTFYCGMHSSKTYLHLTVVYLFHEYLQFNNCSTDDDIFLQCYDAVHWVIWSASGLQKFCLNNCQTVNLGALLTWNISENENG